MSLIATFTLNPAIDVFAVTQEIFDDSKTRCEEAISEPGGGGINVAQNISSLGSSCGCSLSSRWAHRRAIKGVAQ